jgi:hypothetical protein
MAEPCRFHSGAATIWAGSSAVIKPLPGRAQLAQIKDLSIQLNTPTNTPVLELHKRAQRIDQYSSLYRSSFTKCMKQACHRQERPAARGNQTAGDVN